MKGSGGADLGVFQKLNKIRREMSSAMDTKVIVTDLEYYQYKPCLQIELESEDGVRIYLRNAGRGRALKLRCWVEDGLYPGLRNKNTALRKEVLQPGETVVYPLEARLGFYDPQMIRAQYDSEQGTHLESCLSHASDPRPELTYRQIEDEEIVDLEKSRW